MKNLKYDTLLKQQHVKMTTWVRYMRQQGYSQNFSYTKAKSTVMYTQIEKKYTRLIFADSFVKLQNENNDKVLNYIYKYRAFANVNKCNYLSINKNEKIKVNLKPKTHKLTDTGNWSLAGRQEIKLKSLLTILFNKKIAEKFTDSDYEISTNIIKGFDQPLKIVNADIDEIYSLSLSGWSQTSCMEGDLSYLDMYRQNPEVFQGIFFKTANNIIVGRALLVTTDTFTYVDRIYYKNSEHLKLCQNAAKDAGYYFKTHNTYCNPTQFTTYEGIEETIYISVQLNNIFYDNYPYMDTLHYFQDGILQNYAFEDIGEYYKLQDTGGGYETYNVGIYDDIDDCFIDEEDAVTINYGRQEGCTTHVDNCYYSNANDGYILH